MFLNQPVNDGGPAAAGATVAHHHGTVALRCRADAGTVGNLLAEDRIGALKRSDHADHLSRGMRGQGGNQQDEGGCPDKGGNWPESHEMSGPVKTLFTLYVTVRSKPSKEKRFWQACCPFRPVPLWKM